MPRLWTLFPVQFSAYKVGCDSFLLVSTYRVMFYGSADCFNWSWHIWSVFFFLLFLSFTFPSTSLWKDVFLSLSHHLVMIKTGGLWQPVRGNCTRWMIAEPGLEKRAIVSTLWLLLVLGEMKAQVLAPARHIIDGWVCSIREEGLCKNKGGVKWVLGCIIQP